jgi:NTE family protein
MEKYALVLGGGGARGANEIGVWQALRELEIPVHIVTGTSVGALNGCLVAQDRFDDAVKIWEEMETHKVFDVEENDRLRRLNTGTTGLEDVIRTYADETLLRNSDIDFGLVTVQLPDMTPHELFVDEIPEGMLHDLIRASASFFPALAATDIDGTKFMDGGYHDVMPIDLAMQKNPDHMIAVYLDGAGILRRKSIENAKNNLKSFRLIECEWNLGKVLNFDTDNSKRIMRLGYLDAMKSYDKYEGSKYTFEKGEFNEHGLKGAEAAADIFALDPTIIYTKDNLCSSLMIAVANSPAAEIHDNLLDILKSQLSSGSLVINIARDLLHKEANSIFLTKQAFKLLTKEIQAANFLIKAGIV